MGHSRENNVIEIPYDFFQILTLYRYMIRNPIIDISRIHLRLDGQIFNTTKITADPTGDQFMIPEKITSRKQIDRFFSKIQETSHVSSRSGVSSSISWFTHWNAWKTKEDTLLHLLFRKYILPSITFRKGDHVPRRKSRT